LEGPACRFVLKGMRGFFARALRGVENLVD
jgi:hypothetical protein